MTDNYNITPNIECYYCKSKIGNTNDQGSKLSSDEPLTRFSPQLSHIQGSTTTPLINLSSNIETPDTRITNKFSNCIDTVCHPSVEFVLILIVFFLLFTEILIVVLSSYRYCPNN